MDSYITKEWYRATYPCVNAFIDDDTGLTNAIFEASRVIDERTFQRATLFDDLDEATQEYIMYAVAAQVDFMAGIEDPEMISGADYRGGVSIGKFSESVKSDTRIADAISPKAIKYLRLGILTKNGFKDHNAPARYSFDQSAKISGDYDV
ncbi:MAG: hypothetical protein WC374_10275 [Phycisphaerae bacterium]|jgi:hypothetical protein